MDIIDPNASALLNKAASEGEYDELQELIDTEKFDTSLLNNSLFTCVSRCQAASEHLICVEALLNAGGSPNYKDSQGVTPLMKAASLGQIELLDMLLYFGGKVNDKDHNKKTVLMYSVTGYGDNEDVVVFLLEKGAMVNEEDLSGNSCLHMAATSGLANTVAALLKFGACIDLQNFNKETPLQLATRNRHKSTEKVLLDFKAGLDLEGKLSSADEAPEEQKAIVELEDDKESLVSFEEEEEIGLICSSCEEKEESVKYESEVQEILRHEEEKFQMTENDLQSIITEKEEKFKIENENLKKILEKQEQEIQKLKKKKKVQFFHIETKEPVDYLADLKKDIEDFIAETDIWQSNFSHTQAKIQEELQKLTSDMFPDTTLEVFGSFYCNLHLPYSDIDLVVTNATSEKRTILQSLHEHTFHSSHIKTKNLIIGALVPILKLKISLDEKIFDIDISVEDHLHQGRRCREFVQRILTTFPCIRPVFLVFKNLFYLCNFKEPFTGGIGSYALFLLILSFVQANESEVLESEDTPGFETELFLRVFTFYTIEFSYKTDIKTYDPEISGHLPSFHHAFVSGIQENFTLYVGDPHNSTSNVAHGTDVSVFWHILRTAYAALNRVSPCGCEECRRPLLRMFIELKNTSLYYGV